MDRELLVVLVIAILASGCINDPPEKPGSVVIQDFSIDDNTLIPDQKTQVTAKIKNFNQAPTQVNTSNVTLFNTGALKVLRDTKTCTPDSIGRASEGFSPQMKCMWTVQAPGESYIRGFKSKPLTFDLRVRYSSTLENTQEIDLDFRKMDSIDVRNKLTRQFSNSDVKMKIEAESPIPVDVENVLTIKAWNKGPGAIKENISFSYTPKNIFTEECPDERKLIRGQTMFSCPVRAGSTGTRNVFVATHYKYQRTKSLGIEVVNKQ